MLKNIFYSNKKSLRKPGPPASSGPRPKMEPRKTQKRQKLYKKSSNNDTDIGPMSLEDLEKLLQKQDVVSYNSICVRKKSNWSKLDPLFIFDNTNFDARSLLQNAPVYSSKLQALLDKIDELDKRDLKEHGKQFKHFIFSDLKTTTYGVKLLASALIAKGFHLGYSAKSKSKQRGGAEDVAAPAPPVAPARTGSKDKKGEPGKPTKKRYDNIELLSQKKLLETPGDNFFLLTSAPVYDQMLTAATKKTMLAAFNSRPDNIHGELARFIIMDSGFKEGIDLFDIKYCHIFEPAVVPADQTQIVGRGTRTCGQKGLDFQPNRGWKLDVFIYDLSIPDAIQNSFLQSKTAIDLYLKTMNIDVRLMNFANDVEKTIIFGAVDFELNQNIHNFSLKDFVEGSRSASRKSTEIVEPRVPPPKPPKPVNLIGPPEPPKPVNQIGPPEPPKPVNLIGPPEPPLLLEDKKGSPKLLLKDVEREPARLLLEDKKRSPKLLLKDAEREPARLLLEDKKRSPKLLLKDAEREQDPKRLLLKNDENRGQKAIQNGEGKGSPTLLLKYDKDRIKDKEKLYEDQEKAEAEAAAEAEAEAAAEAKVPPKKYNMNSIDGGAGGIQLRDPAAYESFDALRQNIRERYSKYKWKTIKIENLCIEKGGSGAKSIQFSPSQDFVRHYFTPQNPLKGMLYWWSVGTGKTCAAIATATTSFEQMDYTILWVTRTTLKTDIWKNMFDQVCHESIRTKLETPGFKMPTVPKKQMDLLSKSWSIRPMSYKQFSNMVSQRNSMYKDLVKKNGEQDPLRKTLIIIDEAHKLYGQSDLTAQERPDMKAFRRSLDNSYRVSGNDSVRLLLMTATPITKNPMEIIQLLNLCKREEKQMPAEFNTFSAKYLGESGEFTEDGRAQFLNDINGTVSYLNREKDVRQFAQPHIQYINSPLIADAGLATRFDKAAVKNVPLNRELVETLKGQYAAKNQELATFRQDSNAEKLKVIRNKYCARYAGADKKRCEKTFKENSKEFMKDVKDEIAAIRAKMRNIKERIEIELDGRKNALRKIKEDISTHPDEYKAYLNTQFYALKTDCASKTTKVDVFHEKMRDHPQIKEYSRAIETYQRELAALTVELDEFMNAQVERLAEIKQKMATEGMAEAEKAELSNQLQLINREYATRLRERQQYKRVNENRLKKQIKETDTKRNKRFTALKKTVKRMVKEKREKEMYDLRENKPTATLREKNTAEFQNDEVRRIASKHLAKIDADMANPPKK